MGLAALRTDAESSRFQLRTQVFIRGSNQPRLGADGFKRMLAPVLRRVLTRDFVV